MAEFTYFSQEQPLWLIAGALFTAQVAAREAGRWVRRRVARASDGPAEESSDSGFILTGVLGLLALLIAFTFNLALDRYEARRDLVIAEANAIGTAEMRANLLAPEQARKLAPLLWTYAETRLQFGQAAAEDKAPLARASQAQRGALQTATFGAIGTTANSPLGALVAQAINSVCDVGVERDTMLAERVPFTVLAVLGAYTLMTAASLGYGLATVRTRRQPPTTVLFALLTVATVMILDLDRPQGGTVRINQSPLIDLVAGFPASAISSPTAEPAAPP